MNLAKGIRNNLQQIVEGSLGNSGLIIVASAHKTGSTWLFKMLQDLIHCPVLKPPIHARQRHPNVLSVDIPIDEIIESARRPLGYRVMKSHSMPPRAPLPDWMKLVTITRDPRDVLVSSAFYLANLPEEEGGWGVDFGSLNVKQRLLKLIEEAEFLRNRLQAWHTFPEACQVRYETLLESPAEELGKISAFLHRTDDVDRVQQVVESNNFKRQSGRTSGTEDRSAFLRKGIRGDWKNHFDDDLRSKFQHACGGDWNRLLLDLGYEKGSDW